MGSTMGLRYTGFTTCQQGWQGYNLHMGLEHMGWGCQLAGDTLRNLTWYIVHVLGNIGTEMSSLAPNIASISATTFGALGTILGANF